jgi:hypothetical protein
MNSSTNTGTVISWGAPVSSGADVPPQEINAMPEEPYQRPVVLLSLISAHSAGTTISN